MNYLTEFKKFIFSHHLSTGFRLTLGAVVPSLIFYQFGILDKMIAFPLGTLLIGATDNPGPFQYRRNALLIAILTCCTVAAITGLLREVPYIAFAEIIVFGMLFSLAGVYGNRVNSIGLIALLVFVFNIDDHLSGDLVLHTVFVFALGGLWYFILFLILQKLRPYLLIKQLLGENFNELGKLLANRSQYYFAHPDYENLFSQMVHQQVILRENHETLREILFKTREFVNESTNTSRTLMLMFLDSIDLFERILNSQQDYQYLHKRFDHSRILRLFGTYMSWLSFELQEIGIAVQSGFASHPKHDLDEAFHRCQYAFEVLRKDNMNHHNIEDYMMLRQILSGLQDITERVKKLHRATAFDARLNHNPRIEVPVDEVIPKQDYHPNILLDNLSFQSSHFRHAVRVTFGLLLGYLSSLFLDLGHGYWILLTVVTIMKPAFSLTKQRNLHRIAGTFLGVLAGAVLLYFVQDGAILFSLLLISMVTAYTFLKTNYFVASTSITLYVILSLYFINPINITDVFQDRLLDTFIGSVIAFLISSTILPVWENSQMSYYMHEALLKNKAYFDMVSRKFTGHNMRISDLKVNRKNAFIAMANLSDHFEKMLSEPKRKQKNMEEFHQFVATSHMLTSYIASLSTYAQSTDYKGYVSEFSLMTRHIDRQFQTALNINDGLQKEKVEVSREALPPNKMLIEQLAIRKKEIKEAGVSISARTPERKQLSDIRTINGLFELINTITVDEIKILQKLNSTID